MGIFKSLFGNSESEVKKQSGIAWNTLNDLKQLEELVANSHSKYQVIFKHSTRCGVSSGVLRQFERQEDLGSIDFYILDLLSYRTLSDDIAERFGVLHQSPQLIALKQGKVAAHASHYDIMRMKLEEF